MNNTTNQSRYQSNNTLFVLLLLASVITFYFVDFHTYSNYVLLPVTALYLPAVFSCLQSLNKTKRVFVIVSFAILILRLLYRIVGYSDFSSGDLSWTLSGVISVVAMSLFSDRDFRVVFSSFTVILVVFMTVLLLAGRSLEENEATLIASTSLGSMLMLITGMSLIMLLRVKSLSHKAIAIVLLVLTIYINLFIFQRGTNILFTFIEVLIILVLSLKSKIVVRIVLLGILIGVLSLYLTGFYVTVFDWIASVVPSERLAVRFEQLSYYLQFGDLSVAGGSLESRAVLMRRSWDAFISNPIFGAGEHRGNNLIIGHHSLILDNLGAFGILGAILLFIYFKMQYKIMLSALNKKDDSVLFWQCTVVFLFYLLRNAYGIVATAAVNFTLLVYFPLMIQIIKNSRN